MARLDRDEYRREKARMRARDNRTCLGCVSFFFFGGLLLVGLAVGAVYLVTFLPPPDHGDIPVAPSAPEVGREYALESGGKRVAIARDAQTLRELVKALQVEDKEKRSFVLAVWLANGAIVSVPAWTRVEVVDVGSDSVGVRVLDGEHKGSVGRVIPLWLKPADAAPPAE